MYVEVIFCRRDIWTHVLISEIYHLVRQWQPLDKKRYSTFPKSPRQEPPHPMLLCLMQDTHWQVFLLLCSDALGVFYSTSWLGWKNEVFSFIQKLVNDAVEVLWLGFIKCMGCPCGVMVKAMDCGIVVREFVLQSRYYVHFWANTLGKGMNPLILPAMG